jgi:ankyrin repeat protein
MVNITTVLQYLLIDLSHRTVERWSDGNGKFIVDKPPFWWRSSIAFVVHKSRITKDIFVNIQSEALRNALHAALQRTGTDIPGSLGALEYQTLFRHYSVFKLFLAENESESTKRDQGITELKLLVRDFLLDQTVFDGFGLEYMYQQGILSASHWADIQEWSRDRDLDVLQDCFSMGSEGAQNDKQEDKDASAFLLEYTLEQKIRLGYVAAIPDLLRKLGSIPAFSLLHSLELRDLEIFWLLLAHGAPVDGETLQVRSPLHVAAKNGHSPAVYALLYRGANPNGNSCGNPLAAAAGGGHLDIVRVLIQSGAEINGDSGGNLLAPAVGGGHLDIVQGLVQSGADIHGNSSKCPLRMAATQGHSQVVQYLLQNDADVSCLVAPFPMEAPHETYGYIFLDSNYISEPFDPLKDCPVSVAIQAQERRRELGIRLHESLVRTSKKFLETSLDSSASLDFKVLAAELSDHEQVWKKGMATIRRLFKNHLPGDLNEVFSFMQVAEAMRATGKKSEYLAEPMQSFDSFL